MRAEKERATYLTVAQDHVVKVSCLLLSKGKKQCNKRWRVISNLSTVCLTHVKKLFIYLFFTIHLQEQCVSVYLPVMFMESVMFGLRYHIYVSYLQLPTKGIILPFFQVKKKKSSLIGMML